MQLRCPQCDKCIGEAHIKNGTIDCICKKCKKTWRYSFKTDIEIKTTYKIMNINL